MISFNYVYEINGKFIERDEINVYTKEQYDTSHEMQGNVLKIGIDDITTLSKLFEDENRQVPTHVIMSYNNKSGEFKSMFFYDNMLGELDMPEDITLDLIKKLKS